MAMAAAAVTSVASLTGTANKTRFAVLFGELPSPSPSPWSWLNRLSIRRAWPSGHTRAELNALSCNACGARSFLTSPSFQIRCQISDLRLRRPQFGLDYIDTSLYQAHHHDGVLRAVGSDALDTKLLDSEEDSEAIPLPDTEETKGNINIEADSDASARLVIIVGEGSVSPFDDVLWEDVMLHMGQKLTWINVKIQTEVFSDSVLRGGQGPAVAAVRSAFMTAFERADIVVAVEIRDQGPVTWLAKKTRSVGTFLALDSAPQLLALVRLGGVVQSGASFQRGEGEEKEDDEVCVVVDEEEKEEMPVSSLLVSIAQSLPWTSAAKKIQVAKRTNDTVQQAWARRKADDVLFVLTLLIDTYVMEIPQLKNLRAQNISALWCMITKCGPKIAACLADPTCSKALECLNKCPPTDQVCSYRCIVSYESPLFEEFSRCILQKHNCLDMNAEIPSTPDVQPMSTFRALPLTHELAEDLFIGWLGEEQCSWRVVAGQNAAYDQFPCQYQLFYRGRARKTMWYDPVFQVRTLDGRVVWRRRHYRVRRAQTPGTFYFSVLDNGVVSLEYWRIVDVADDLSWSLFYYSGAAAAAGQSYMGAVLCTPDGRWPNENEEVRVIAALQRAGIKKWELYGVDNSCCEGAPLGISAKVGLVPLRFEQRLASLQTPTVTAP